MSAYQLFGEDIKSVSSVLAQSIDLLKNADPFHIEDITDCLKNKFPRMPLARAAIDMTLHDFIDLKLKTTPL